MAKPHSCHPSGAKKEVHQNPLWTRSRCLDESADLYIQASGLAGISKHTSNTALDGYGMLPTNSKVSGFISGCSIRHVIISLGKILDP